METISRWRISATVAWNNFLLKIHGARSRTSSLFNTSKRQFRQCDKTHVKCLLVAILLIFMNSFLAALFFQVIQEHTQQSTTFLPPAFPIPTDPIQTIDNNNNNNNDINYDSTSQITTISNNIGNNNQNSNSNANSANPSQSSVIDTSQSQCMDKNGNQIEWLTAPVWSNSDDNSNSNNNNNNNSSSSSIDRDGTDPENLSLTNVKYIFFHRVAKTGTETIFTLFRIFSSIQSFSNEIRAHHNDLEHNFCEELFSYEILTLQRIAHEYLPSLRKCKDPTRHDTCFVRSHAPFIDNSLGYRKDHIDPILETSLDDDDGNNDNINIKNRLHTSTVGYITMVRDPIQRIFSLFYYMRGRGGGYRASEQGQRDALDTIRATKNLTLRECVEDMIKVEKENKNLIANGNGNGNNNYKKDVCRLSSNYMTHFFCGQDMNVCSYTNMTQASLDRAISNIDKYFAFVGLFEEYHLSMRLLYYKFKHFFDRAKTKNYAHFQELLNKEMEKYRKEQEYGTYKNDYLDENDPLYQYLVSRNELDIKLYQHIKQKFYACIVSQSGLKSVNSN